MGGCSEVPEQNVVQRKGALIHYFVMCAKINQNMQNRSMLLIYK